MGYYVDGRASCVVGTHTHAPTADERVLPRGTAFVSDIGMCGDYELVLGMDPGEPLNRFLTKIPRGRFEPAMGPATISGLAVEIDDSTGLAPAHDRVAARWCFGTYRAAVLGRVRKRELSRLSCNEDGQFRPPWSRADTRGSRDHPPLGSWAAIPGCIASSRRDARCEWLTKG